MKKLLTSINDKIRKRKKVEEPKNPNAKNYNMFNTFVYAIKKAAKYKKSYVVAILVGSVSYAAYNFVGIYMPKIIIEMIEKNVPVEELVIAAIIIGMTMLILNMIYYYTEYCHDWDFLYVQENIDNERLNKIFSTDYANLESPEFLDYTEKAKRATWHWNGFHSVYRRFSNIIYQGIMVIVSAVSILVLNPVIVAVISVLAYATYKIFDLTTIEDKIRHRDALAPIYRKLTYMCKTCRNFDFAKDIRLFKMENWFEKIFGGLNQIVIDKEREHHRRWIICDAKMNSIVLIQSVLLYTWLVYMVLVKGMSIADFTLYVGLVNALSKNITDLFGNLTFLTRSRMEINDFRTVMEWPEKAMDKENGEGEITDIDFENYEFKFENVSFKYPGHDTYALKDINLTITPKMKLAVVGVNGAGKTTFTKLLMKLYEPTEGRILLNGVDLKRYDRKSYFNIFSPVFQNVECFAFPLWENVSFKDANGTDRDKVEACIKTSGLNDKIDKFPKGIDTEMLKIFHEDGVDLSGGEKQRLAMARALYKGGSVVVLDEPTAALDSLAEDKMYREFDMMVENKTSVFISHRLSSTRFCDKIAMFDNGEVVEYGTHDELMDKNGKYAEMYNIQAQYYREEAERGVKLENA